MSEFLKRTWARIDLDAIEHNYHAIRRSLTGGSRLMAVVKADAYGHGAACVARTLQAAGADWFGVSNLQEAIQLREEGITRPILILSYTPPEEAARLAAFGITQAVISREYAERLNEAAAAAGVVLPVHVKLDTGMSRVGFFYHDEVADAPVIHALTRVCRLPQLLPQGIFTHFASADEEDGGFTEHQFALFTHAIQRLEQAGITFELKHCCNSAATLRFPHMHLDMVRPGIILYGAAPAPWMEALCPLTPAMSLKTVVSLVKEIPADTCVSYGRTFRTHRPTAVATVPIGYADGYPRSLSGTARMLVAGQSVPLVGRVCMDQCLLDVTGVPDIREGMTVTVFGRDGGTCLPVEELAALAGTIHYEIVCLIGKRVPRIFYRGGDMIGKQDYFSAD